MREVTPQTFLVARTEVDDSEVDKYLSLIGAPDWDTDTHGDAQELTEIMGRACYRAFGAELNANITRTRSGNEKYIKNIIASGHGSVLEHGTVSFIFHNVSRVFTHELVRHRVGTAFSQESLRYVRLTDLGLWLPHNTLHEAMEYVGEERVNRFVREVKETFEYLEKKQLDWAELFQLDSGKDFPYKKKVTSMMRRCAPIGLATSIGFSANHRTLRHLIEMRTSRHAEEEIRLVFGDVAEICLREWPHLYGDYSGTWIDGLLEYTTENRKI